MNGFAGHTGSNSGKHMKKYIAITAALFTLGTAGFAQASATLTISGTVAAINTITIASQTGYNSLNIVSGETDKLVGIATETSNDVLGYKVTLSSANAGSTAQAFLAGTGGNTDTVNYSIKYGGTAVTLASGSAIVTTAAARTASTGVAKNITVTLAGSWRAADTYSDTLTLTIAGN